MLKYLIWYSWSKCSFKLCFDAHLRTKGNIDLDWHEFVFVSDKLSMIIFNMKPSNAMKTCGFRASVANETLKQDAQTQVADDVIYDIVGGFSSKL